MRYLFWEFEGEYFWIEITEEGFAQRQIIKQADNKVLVSCRQDCLAEGKIENDYIKNFEINRQEFEEKWVKYTKEYRVFWEEAKKFYEIGKKVEGTVLYFYPQGIIFSVGKIQGIADYDEYSKRSKFSNLYPNHKIIGEVIGYDEKNMWLVITGGCVI